MAYEQDPIDLEALEYEPAVAMIRAAIEPQLGAKFEQHYLELKRLARAERQRVLGGHSLNTTALVNELYLKLLHSGSAGADGKHFFALSALAIRHILVDRARHRVHVRAHAEAMGSHEDGSDDTLTLEIHDALDRLRQFNPRLAAVVTCRWFAGYSEPETAQALSVGERTVRRDWERARLWLQAALTGATP
ncbi:MAG: RNA polymerase subunit sigma [Ahniella sp.]|nr:RNA polymerase subunit sigma [Ahniella sp.]